jgi:endonuclease-3
MAFPPRVTKIFKILRKTYPDARSELIFKNPLELLVATILSAQCTDKRVNIVTESLFRKYKTPADYENAPLAQLQDDIRSVSFHRNKAKFIKEAAGKINREFGGKVPNTLDKLITLPGVGRKTANVVLGNIFNIPGITCDTHVIRLSGRLGFSKNTDPVKLELDLQKLIPQKDWTIASHLLIFHGRRCCYARKPECPRCPVLKLCPYPDKTKTLTVRIEAEKLP